MKADVDLLVVGGGPAGLEAARATAVLGHRVLVVDREPRLGGVPRHCHHTGFGWFDLRRVWNGPAYAQHRVELARSAGVELRAETSALSWNDPSTLLCTAPDGPSQIRACAVLLATGCRERPRSARLVPGTRPHGVFTTGSLQQLVHLSGRRAGRRAVVVGAEHVSFSAVHTLTSTGTEVAAMITDLPAHQSFEPFLWGTAWWHDVPIHCYTELTRIDGARRVEAVELTDLATGARRQIECDTVVFTGDFIPDHELARSGGLKLDAGTRGPEVDGALRSSVPGVFAAGNLLHGAEMADVAALEGRHAAHAIQRFLDGGAWQAERRLRILVDQPLRWVFPNVVVPGAAPPQDRFIFRSARFRQRARVEVWQDQRLLHTQRYRSMVPNRALHLSASWLPSVDDGGGPVRLVC